MHGNLNQCAKKTERSLRGAVDSTQGEAWHCGDMLAQVLVCWKGLSEPVIRISTQSSLINCMCNFVEIV